MAAPYILARTLKEAHDFARGELGLRNGQYRVVNSSGTLKSVRNADLYLLPGWERRYDRFAVKSALRWTRMNVIDTTRVESRAEAPADPRGPLTDDVIDLAYAEHAVRSGEGAPGIVTTGVRDDLEPAGEQLTLTPEPEAEEKPKVKRRRSRCKDCGTLHFKGEPCPEDE